MQDFLVLAPAAAALLLVHCCVRFRSTLGSLFFPLYVVSCLVGATGGFAMLRVGWVEQTALASAAFALSFFGFSLLLARVRKYLATA